MSRLIEYLLTGCWHQWKELHSYRWRQPVMLGGYRRGFATVQMCGKCSKVRRQDVEL